MELPIQSVRDDQTAPSTPAMPPHAQPMGAPKAASPFEQSVGHALNASAPPIVPHTQTESTLAPTAEFTRIFLLAWIIRYIFRGGAGATFEKTLEQGGLRAKILNGLSVPGRAIEKWIGGGTPKVGWQLPELEAAAYSTAIGVGSGALSWQYSRMVKRDIQNLFSESVAEEKGIPQAQVTFDDIRNSDNKIIQRTVENYSKKKWSRLGSDALFLVAAPLRSGHLTDLLLGVKGIEIFADTWKRKTTMFEDLVTFVNNKINPRNGLGQPVSQGEIFDLYQHYAEAFAPQKMFNNVLSKNASGRWAQSQPIFQRITDLMNETYAYKHTTPADYNAAKMSGSDFPLPKLIYMLGHDMIDADRPERTLALVEIMNAKGSEAVRHALTQLDTGIAPRTVLQAYGLSMQAPKQPEKLDNPNGVLPKGSTMQLERTEAGQPSTQVDASSISQAQALTGRHQQALV